MNLRMNLRHIHIPALALMMSAATAIPSQAAEFNVSTYNLRQQNEADSLRGDIWSRRCSAIADIARFHEFNIFGTQEGFKNQLEDLKALLPDYEYTGVAREDGRNAGEHSAIFYDTTMFELIDHGDFWLSETPEKPGLGWDAACVRICSWGKFRHKDSGKEFQFFNLHLDHIGTKARIESIHLVERKIREIGIDLPTILTGDFNVDQTNEMYGVLCSAEFLKDSYSEAHFRYAPTGTFNDYDPSSFTTSRIDHIFISPQIEVEKYGVLTDTYRSRDEGDRAIETQNFPEEVELRKWRSRVPSDHYPVKIRIKM